MLNEFDRVVMVAGDATPVTYRFLETGGNYRHAMASVPREYTPSGMRHEGRIIRHMREDVTNPLSFEPFSEVFGIENGGRYARLMLSTKLRVPSGYSPAAYETDGGSKYWRRLLVEGGEKREVLIPESGVVCEFDGGTWLPRVTGPACEIHYPYAVSFEFDPSVQEVPVVIKADRRYDKGLVIEAARSIRHRSKDTAVRLVRL